MDACEITTLVTVGASTALILYATAVGIITYYQCTKRGPKDHERDQDQQPPG